MSEQDNLENHLRHLAETHESPYNPADWADMQRLLQKQAVISAPQSPLRGLFRRSVVMLALMCLTGIKVLYDAPLPAHLGLASKKENEDKNEVKNQNNKQKTLPTQATNSDTYSNNTQNSTSFERNFTNQNQRPSTLSNEVSVDSTTESAPIEWAAVLSVDSSQSLQSLQSVGFIVQEPFQHKEPQTQEINPIVSTTTNKTDSLQSPDYQHLEIYAGESFQTNLALKVGKGQLYNILAVGYQFTGGGRWGFGYGFGKEIRRQGRNVVNLELVGYYIKENTMATPLNILAQTKLQFNRRFTPHVAGFVSLNANALISDNRNEDLVNSAGIPNWMVLHTFLGGTSVKLWSGINLGVQVRLSKLKN